jgi:hypothetical protein
MRYTLKSNNSKISYHFSYQLSWRGKHRFLPLLHNRRVHRGAACELPEQIRYSIVIHQTIIFIITIYDYDPIQFHTIYTL